MNVLPEGAAALDLEREHGPGAFGKSFLQSS